MEEEENEGASLMDLEFYKSIEKKIHKLPTTDWRRIYYDYIDLEDRGTYSGHYNLKLLRTLGHELEKRGLFVIKEDLKERKFYNSSKDIVKFEKINDIELTVLYGSRNISSSLRNIIRNELIQRQVISTQDGSFKNTDFKRYYHSLSLNNIVVREREALK